MQNKFNILIINLFDSADTCDICSFFDDYEYNTIELNKKDDVCVYLNKNSDVNLIIINSKFTDKKSKYLIEQIRQRYNLNIIFLTNDESIEARKEFFSYNLLDYKIKNDPLHETLGEVVVLINKLINNKNETILIIKKENQTRNIITKLLTQRAYNLIITSNAKSGWYELENNNNISMVILDISIKNIKSHELILFAKEKFNQNIPVIALTSNYDALLMQHNIEYGLSDFIQVPIVHEEFNLKVDLWINNIRQARKLQNQQQLLTQNLKTIQALSNATIEGLIMFDDNICVDVNDAAIVMFEYDNKEELLGKHILDIVSSNITQFDKGELLKNSVDHEFELLMTKKNNKDFPAQIKERNVHIDTKQLKVIAVLDLTDIKKKEEMLSQQSKMASMGEMIGNIAHQWRQPLTSISIAASNIKLNYELDMVEEDELFEALDGITDSTKFLSETIDDFRDFIKGESIKYSFVLEDLIKRVLKLVEGNINSVNIKVIENYQKDIEMYGFGNELTQSILNVVNNARDILKEKDIKNKFIFIDTKKQEENIIINIQDNAGGVPTEILPKIFEPYFTTKHQSQGTGLGLYMTHQMIVDHMHGKIDVTNTEFKYENEIYNGALFKIIIPIK